MQNALLGLFIALNAGFVALALVLLHRRGGLAYLRKRLSGRAAARELGPIEKAREDVWAAMPVQEGGWIFVGDSLIDLAPLSELFQFPAIGRGRSGDKIADVAVRLGEIARHRPARIILWIGLNDLVAGRSAEEILRGIVFLAQEIRTGNPSVPLAVVGVPVLSSARGARYLEMNQTARQVNLGLKAHFPGPEPRFIDPLSALADSDGNLRTEFSPDGSHLNGAGYLAWRDMLCRDLPV